MSWQDYPAEQSIEDWLTKEHAKAKTLFQKYAQEGNELAREQYRGETAAIFAALQHLRIQKERYGRY